MNNGRIINERAIRAREIAKRKRARKIRTIKTVLEIISVILLFIGFGIIIGTAGASDCDMIEMNQIIPRCIVGLLFMIPGSFLAWLVDSNN